MCYVDSDRMCCIDTVAECAVGTVTECSADTVAERCVYCVDRVTECTKCVDTLGTDQCPEGDISVLGMI